MCEKKVEELREGTDLRGPHDSPVVTGEVAEQRGQENKADAEDDEE